LSNERYVPIEPDDTGALVSEQLDLSMRLEDGELVMYDRRTSEPLLMETEAERAALESEQHGRLPKPSCNGTQVT
jgi:hypothetical protein